MVIKKLIFWLCILLSIIFGISLSVNFIFGTPTTDTGTDGKAFYYNDTTADFEAGENFLSGAPTSDTGLEIKLFCYDTSTDDWTACSESSGAFTSNWEFGGFDFITPTSTVGILVRASSTIDADLTITGNLEMGGNIVSDTDSTDDLGSSGIYWDNLYVAKTINMKSSTGATVTLDTSEINRPFRIRYDQVNARFRFQGNIADYFEINIGGTDITLQGDSVGSLNVSSSAFSALRPTGDSAMDLGESSFFFDETFTDELVLKNEGSGSTAANTIRLTGLDLSAGDTGLLIKTENDTEHLFASLVGISTTTPAFTLDVNGDLRVGIEGNANTFFVDTSEGKVGIGTSSPFVKLSVSGDFYLNGNATTTRNQEVGSLSIGGVALQGTGGAGLVGIALGAGSPTVDQIQEYLDNTGSSGFFLGGELSDGGAGTVDIAAGEGFIRATNDDNAELQSFKWSASSSVAVLDDTTEYVYVDSNGDIILSTDEFLERPDLIQIGVATDEGGSVAHVFSLGVRLEESIGAAGRFIRRVHGIARNNRLGGLIFGQSGDVNRDVTMTAGQLEWGRTTYVITSFNTTGDTFQTYSASGQEDAVASQWPNEQFDNSGTLETMGNNRWANLFFFLEPDDHIVMIYGRAQFLSEALAENEGVPSSSLPSKVSETSILVSRFTFQKSANTATISSAFDTLFANAGVTSHPDLATLGWIPASHTGTALTFAGFDGAGAATEYTEANYILADGTRTLSAPWDMGNQASTTAITPGIIFDSNGDEGDADEILSSLGIGLGVDWIVAETGDVNVSGTPVDNQIAIWTNATTIEGVSGLTYDGSNLLLTGDIGSTGSRITKGWFVNVESDNMYTVGGTSLASTFSPIAGSASILTVGTLDDGSISANFGNIDIGSSNIDADGTITFNGVINFSSATSLAAPANFGGRSITVNSTALDADSELYVYKAKIAFELPVDTDDFFFGEIATHAVTFSSIYCKTLVGTVNLDITIAGIGINGSDITCTTSGVLDDSLGGDTAGTTGEELKLEITSVASDPTYLMVVLNGSYDD